MRTSSPSLSRNLIRLLLAFLAVALVTALLLVWHAHRSNTRDIDCMVKKADGTYQFFPCE